MRSGKTRPLAAKRAAAYLAGYVTTRLWNVLRPTKNSTITVAPQDGQECTYRELRMAMIARGMHLNDRTGVIKFV
ncbi:MAG: hypothetical protein JO051_00040 [Acidobacteriaceae bacterium]|nr:hypothetical protein [Acidobacteriaceae bacterium]